MERILKAYPEDLDVLLPMAMDLWSDYTNGELSKILSQQLNKDKFNILLYHADEEVRGFIYVGIRTDYVEGAESSPTGYIEGIYVKHEYRGSGVSQKLLHAGEQWLRDQGCTQVGSDIYVDNKVSYDFHIRSGFQEAGRLIAFIKNL